MCAALASSHMVLQVALVLNLSVVKLRVHALFLAYSMISIHCVKFRIYTLCLVYSMISSHCVQLTCLSLTNRRVHVLCKSYCSIVLST